MPVLGRASMGSFGDRLKKEREQRSVSLDDIALSTKIGTRMLRALEEEKFDQLPGGIFNKGFVRAYARHLGLDEEQTIHDYMEALGETQQRSMPLEATTAGKPQLVAERPSQPIVETREPEPAAEIPWGLLALGLLLAALGLCNLELLPSLPGRRPQRRDFHARNASHTRRNGIPCRRAASDTHKLPPTPTMLPPRQSRDGQARGPAFARGSGRVAWVRFVSRSTGWLVYSFTARKRRLG